jgi:UDP-glucose 4-epimerase
MRVALTGGTGYVGRHVAERLRGAGYLLRFLTRHPHTASQPGAETALLDLEASIDEETLQGCDVLVHLAAYIPADHTDAMAAERSWRINAWGTLRLAEAAARAGVRHMVHTTSGNAYRPCGGRPRHEDDAMMPMSRGFYLGSKLLQEIYASEVCGRHSVALTTLRLGSVYGGAGATGLVPHLLGRLKAHEPVRLHGGGLFGADFVHVEDVADAVLRVIRARAEGPFNVGSGERTTVLRLARTLARLCGAPDHLMEVAPAPADPDTGFAALDCSRLHALGYAPRDIRQGLVEAISPDRCGVR